VKILIAVLACWIAALAIWVGYIELTSTEIWGETGDFVRAALLLGAPLVITAPLVHMPSSEVGRSTRCRERCATGSYRGYQRLPVSSAGFLACLRLRRKHPRCGTCDSQAVWCSLFGFRAALRGVVRCISNSSWSCSEERRERLISTTAFKARFTRLTRETTGLTRRSACGAIVLGVPFRPERPFSGEYSDGWATGAGDSPPSWDPNRNATLTGRSDRHNRGR
jgi:hypothetical protein